MVTILLLLLAGCDLPRDTEGTSDRAGNGTVRIGRVNDGNSYNQEPAFLLESALHVRGSVRYDAAELLLKELERGELDVVMGVFAKESPWKDRVHFAERDWRGFRVATRNGEHRWAMTVDRALKRAAR